MKIICPYCSAFKSCTFKQADSGEPIICPKCGKDMRTPGWQLPMKGASK